MRTPTGDAVALAACIVLTASLGGFVAAYFAPVPPEVAFHVGATVTVAVALVVSVALQST